MVAATRARILVSISLASLAVLAVAGAPQQARALPIIQEVYYDGPGIDADDVFTELYGVPGFSLDGWTLVGINGATGAVYRTLALTGATIPADGILVLATADAVGSALAERDLVANVDWQNGPDAVQLRDPFDAIVDALQYGDAGAFNAGEGTPAIDVPAGSGSSLSRDLLGTDTDDNFDDFAVLATPTAGAGPPPIPEPAPAALILWGLAGLAALRRRRA